MKAANLTTSISSQLHFFLLHDGTVGHVNKQARVEVVIIILVVVHHAVGAFVAHGFYLEFLCVQPLRKMRGRLAVDGAGYQQFASLRFQLIADNQRAGFLAALAGVGYGNGFLHDFI